MKTADIRRRFLDFFAARGHAVVPSAPLLYHDPTLLFINAGMVPFKPYFTGAEEAPWDRAASVQKCVRTLDIEEVGKTTRHATFFQMNGNFSFGDYFKADAIAYAWELVTNEQHNGGLGFDPEKVWVTVLGGGFHPDYPDGDTKARKLWRKVGVPEDHIQSRGLKDNYWHMGVPGPGGPCSEIYIDRGPEYGPDGGPEADEDRFLEIWNLVFQQEELSAVRAKDDFDVAGPLPTKNIDTGMGLERVAYLLQGVDNLYEIDEVYPVIEHAADLARKRYGADTTDDVRLRVVGDHVRAGLMLMTDGVTPGNEARGYVLRRLLRRSVRSMRLLGVTDPVLPELLPLSRELMSESYPEIDDQWERISTVAYAEEDAFRRTLNEGTRIFDLAADDTRKQGQQTLSGERAFQLHDTYGFPIDLTLEMAHEQGLQVDRDTFTSLMQQQRDRAKADARAKKGGAASTEAYKSLRHSGETRFHGYNELAVESKVLGMVADGQLVNEANPGDIVELVLADTPFYAESGGQDADRGSIDIGSTRLDVLDVQRPVQGLVVHKVEVGGGSVHTGDTALARVDAFHRMGACQAHSATHIIHAVLRETLGPTAVQAGSYNKPGYLRFDFNASGGLSPDQRDHIEGRANEAIRDDLGVTQQELPLAEAKALGAMAMFGEKYPDLVRMVEMGGAWSRELCGGTHVQHSSQIGMLTLLGESSIGSGVRRVEALVSTDAFKHMAAERTLVGNLTSMLKVRPEQLTERIEKLMVQLKDAEKQVQAYKSAEVLAGAKGIADQAKDVFGLAFVGRHVDGVSGGDLRTLATEVRGRLGDRPGVVALAGGTPDKPALVVATTAAGRDRGLKAGELVRLGCEQLGGKGGGKDDLAQGGGSDATAIPRALEAIEHSVGRVATR
ncbi:alanine--tRNA ligase [Enemella dayhoffiae]|uniref:Alanine--tRNA ligase n=1 Tax=Enemella dayhoffiae TaxID=2016507 RepID=A0A255H9P8_9ACTN|nr:alanine--tRNA ligase [Enemella dayhoffiae]OYO24297.1 alanine--tRNA ligase [Enemella dayhoffiae]